MGAQQYLTFKGLARKILDESPEPLTSKEIWKVACETGLKERLNTSGKTPEATLRRDLSQEIKDESSEFGVIYGEPGQGWRYYLKRKVSEPQAKEAAAFAAKKEEQSAYDSSYKEADLHPLVAYFFRNTLNTACKTINHSLSTRNKSKPNKWLHPDMMGISIPFENVKAPVIKLAKGIGSKIVTVYSIEIKQALTPGNIHEFFFQAVSNSTWANEAYLAAASINDDEDFRSELQGLSKSFGVGIINLDFTDPDAARILYQARHREEVDWGRLNRIAQVNSDVLDFVDKASRVIAEHQEERTLNAWFDRVLDRETILSRFRA
jgi:hypothetical protein